MRRDGRFLRGVGAAVFLAGIGVIAGCSDDVVDPDVVSTNILDSHFVPRVENAIGVATNPAVPRLDGERFDTEWGSVDFNTIPWKAIRMTSDHGSGNPGTPMFALVKSVHTEKHIYFLVQWKDSTQDDRKDIFTYVGPDIDRLSVGECYPQYYLNGDYWTRTNDEDWVSFAFEMEPAADPAGSFAEQGCLVACHGGNFGNPTTGRLDVWEWMAARTNPPNVLFNPNDSPVNPLEGEAGYADDLFADANGLQPDEPVSAAAFASNARATDGRVPNLMYRRIEGLCDPDNGGLTPRSAFLWGPCVLQSFVIVECDTMNEAPVDQTAPRKWHAGDTVPGYILKRPDGGRANIRAKGTWENDLHVWTLEIARPLRADASEAGKDVDFDLAAKRDYRFTLAIANNSSDVHYGSEVQTLRFRPQ